MPELTISYNHRLTTVVLLFYSLTVFVAEGVGTLDRGVIVLYYGK